MRFQDRLKNMLCWKGKPYSLSRKSELNRCRGNYFLLKNYLNREIILLYCFLCYKTKQGEI